MITINDVNRLTCTYGCGEYQNEGEMFVVKIGDELTAYCILGSVNFNVTSSELYCIAGPVDMESVIDLDCSTQQEPMFSRQQMADACNDYIALQKEYES